MPNPTDLEQLPPLPAPQVKETPGYWPGVFASISRTSTFLLYSFTREAMMWFFRYPVRFFRPFAVNPYAIFNQMYIDGSVPSKSSTAKRTTSQASWKFIFSSIRKEGISMVYKNIVPVFLLNSLIGIALFNSYSLFSHLLKKPMDGADEILFYINPFLAGGNAGVFQAMLANPFVQIQALLSQNNSLLKFKKQGFIYAAKVALKDLPSYSFLLRGLPFTCIRDGIGFAAFFGVFENLNYHSKNILKKVWQHELLMGPNPPPGSIGSKQEQPKQLYPRSYLIAQGLLTLASGASAATALSLFVYPMDTIRVAVQEAPMKIHQQTSPWRAAISLIKKRGVRSFYSGFPNVLLRSVPASSIGLLVYESSIDYFSDRY